MVDKATCIIDTPLSDALNFNALKAMGIDRLKHLVGETWSNFNESDPGVTILDQLCYALTELGYCADFPINDVLTEKDGRIRYDGQFFEPQHILTCSPVTLDDYRKLVHDRIDVVEAIYIQAELIMADGAAQPSGRYLSAVHLAVEPSKELLAKVQTLLNSHRNLGELFLTPTPIAVRTLALAGTLRLSSTASVVNVQSRVLQALKAYVIPPVVRQGYQQLRDLGVEADEIFNGPDLQQGWVSGPDALGTKRDSVNLFELHALLLGIDGVEQLQGLCFSGPDAAKDTLDIHLDQIPDIDSSALVFTLGTVQHPLASLSEAADYLSDMREQHVSSGVESAVCRYPSLPQGRYRNIEAYYSIQNTFPDTYGIGANSLQSDLPDSRVASSRQLKGYLLVYDQLLANQFSQLAHVSDLFSFKLPKTALYTGSADTRGLGYSGVEVTYHCQPLYDVPGAIPLLRGNDAFHYQADPQQPDKLVARDAWLRFRQHPGNAYLHGLRAMMERVSEAQLRRDRMLTHLMARHGEQADRYDDMIRIGHGYGSDAKSRIVVKGIWLQNYRMLSYYRTCAFNREFATPLKVLPDSRQPHRHQPFAGHPTIDGQLDEALIYQRAELTQKDFRNFSAFELKVDILLGLSTHLLALAGKMQSLLDEPDFDEWLQASSGDSASYSKPHLDISVCHADTGHQLYESNGHLLTIAGAADRRLDRHDYRMHLDQLHWLATQRKSFLLIEHILLLPDIGQGPADYCLSASLVFPDYVGLVSQQGFDAFIQTLLEQHWPAHVMVNVVKMSHVGLRAMIPHFVLWHNSPRHAERREPAARVLARLLRLPAPSEVPHAG
ncbi:hypothetical protein BW686_12900 [Pseudomonas syringae]|uniref:Uncharacterized protein n=1 Tax=Pseudomonas syringae TaxID=317 RepID=A0A244EQM5_PSESX|nr:hypothetical protein [Pseudomonas syringae]OUM06829.1 hypothetical protein BW686_12900 [Pseudomonas syringae]